MIYVFLATGFEDIEAIAPVDIMRRAGLKVQTVSITGERVVMSAGSTNLDACQPLTRAIKQHFETGGAIAAICAAPLVFGHLGLLKGRLATCYPGVDSELRGANYTAAIVEHDGNIITGKGPAAAFEFGEGASLPLRQGMIYKELTEK